MDPLEAILAQYDDIPHVHRALQAVTVLLSAGRKYETSVHRPPTAYLRKVFERRADLDRSRGNLIPGIQEFAHALSTEREPELVRIAVRSTTEEFVIFATPDLARLVGVMVLNPKDAEDWTLPDQGRAVEID